MPLGEAQPVPMTEKISDGFWGLKATVATIVVGAPVEVEKTVLFNVPLLDGKIRADLAGLSDDEVERIGYIGRTDWGPPTVEKSGRVVQRKLVL